VFCLKKKSLPVFDVAGELLPAVVGVAGGAAGATVLKLLDGVVVAASQARSSKGWRQT
jgi:hypothetical protein